jgi:hypothetical protein
VKWLGSVVWEGTQVKAEAEVEPVVEVEVEVLQVTGTHFYHRILIFHPHYLGFFCRAYYPIHIEIVVSGQHIWTNKYLSVTIVDYYTSRSSIC